MSLVFVLFLESKNVVNATPSVAQIILWRTYYPKIELNRIRRIRLASFVRL